ncbi:MAG: energy transducer TonB [Nitrospirae bacterium]|nr:energy transducer TonB [Nitrospirota bacterium]
MKFNLYLAISLSLHLLLFALLSEIYFSGHETAPVFYVDIAPPAETEKPPVKKKISGPAVREKPSALRKPVKDTSDAKPESMFGEGDEKGRGTEGGGHEASEKPGEGSGGNEDLAETSSQRNEIGPYLAKESSPYNTEKIKEQAGGPFSGKEIIKFDTSDLRYRGYMMRLKNHIESVWQYPKEAARLGISGGLDIKFVINRDGTLGDVKIMNPSGFADLDNAALKALDDTFPFDRLPDDWEGDEYVVDGHFIYVHSGVYVR